ncbi:MAG: hypothetical protein JWM80_6 [Cyanobacteria bacterium RYN_339]|nr:hypothetical protein [Cyanobacteria bacterium RYN_339]
MRLAAGVLKSLKRIIAGSLVAALASCAVPVLQAADRAPAFTLDRHELVQRMANPPVVDWSLTHYSTRAADQIRRNEPPAAKQRRVQALSQVSNFAIGKCSNAPAWDLNSKHVYYLSDTGTLFQYTVAANGTTSLVMSAQVKDSGGTNQTFANTQITLSNNGRRAYLTSLQGNFLVINTYTGACNFSAAIGLNTTFTQPAVAAGNPPSICLAPWIDNATSNSEGQWETVYALSNSGNAAANTCSLRRYAVVQIGTAATPTVTLADTYSIPMNTTAPSLEGVRVSPLVFAGKAVIGTWKKNTTSAKLDIGQLIYYDTKCTAFTTSATSGPGTIRTIPVADPIWGVPTVDLDDNYAPFFVFVPTASAVTIIDINGAQTGQCPPLLVDKATPPTTDAAGGTVTPAQSLHLYPYNTAGIVNVNVNPVVDASSNYESITISGNATNLNDSASLTDLTRFYSYRDYNGTAPMDAAYAYAKFYFDPAIQTVGTEPTPRGINKVTVRLNANNSSNPGCCGQAYDSTIPTLDCWLVKSTLTTGAAWTTTNITPGTRPTFLDGTSFNSPASNSHPFDNLPFDPTNNVGNRFRSGNTYDWLADSLIAPGDTKTVGFYDDNDEVGNASNNGKPHNIGTPLFDNGTSSNRPLLHVELSSAGLFSPTMTVPITIDSWTQQIYAVNTNALYRVSYQSFAYTGANQYNAACVPECISSFADDQKAFYAMTALGANATYGPLFTHATAPTTRYVGNQCAPLLTYTSVFVQDNFMDTAGAYNRSSIREFTFGTVPTASAYGTPPVPTGTDQILTTTAADAKGPGTYLVFDSDSTRLFAASYDPAAGGRAWILNR